MSLADELNRKNKEEFALVGNTVIATPESEAEAKRTRKRKTADDLEAEAKALQERAAKLRKEEEAEALAEQKRVADERWKNLQDGSKDCIIGLLRQNGVGGLADHLEGK